MIVLLTVGGASDIRVNGIQLTDRTLIVGGGGGHRGIEEDGRGFMIGGAGGGLIGGDGPNATTGERATGGKGGSQSAGGYHGCGSSQCGAFGDGKLGQGG